MSSIEKFSLTDGPHRKFTSRNKARSKPVKVANPTTPKAPYARAAREELSRVNSEWLKEFFADNHSENLNLLCKNFGFPHSDIERLRSLAKDVISEWELSCTVHNDYNDWSRHLISAMRIKNRDNQRPQPQKSSSNDNPQPQSVDYTFKGGFGGVDV